MSPGVAAAAACDAADEIMEKDRQTSGESSLSTRKACMAAEARRAVGRGKSMVLELG